MKRAIEEKVPGIVVSGEPTPSVSGAFEVANAKTDKKYHSKLGGQGYLHNDQAKLDAVVEAIKADMNTPSS